MNKLITAALILLMAGLLVAWALYAYYPVPHNAIGWVVLVFIGVPLMVFAEGGESPELPRIRSSSLRLLLRALAIAAILNLVYVGYSFVVRVIQR